MKPPQSILRRRQRWRARGTTLLEIVITVAIMTIGMLGYFTLHIRSFQVSGSALTMTQAASLAGALQDELLAIPYTDPDVPPAALDPSQCAPSTTPDSLADLPCPSANSYINAEGRKDAHGAFFRSYSTASINSDPKQIEITVRVRYKAEDGRCAGCSAYQSGYKAITTRIVRTRSAY